MVLSGRNIVDEGHVEVPDGEYDLEAQIQPNGLDLRVDEFATVRGTAVLGLDKSMDTSAMKVEPVDWLGGSWCELKAGHYYVVNFREKIRVPPHYCAIIVGRSSLLRVGSFITSALWDAGFYGHLGCVIRPLNSIKIEKGSRLAQIVFLEAEKGDLYAGQYQGTTSQTALMNG